MNCPARRRLRVVGLSLVVGLLTSGSALACSMAVVGLDHRDDPLDAAAPSELLSLEVVAIQRGRGPHCDPSGVCMQSSCDELGFVELRFHPPTDDRSEAAELGYVTWVSDGSSPDDDGSLDQVDPRMAEVRDGEAHLVLSWLDGATDDQEALDLVLAVAAVDQTGKQGPAAHVHVQHSPSRESDGRSPEGGASGCAHDRVGATGLAGLACAGLMLVGRRHA